jgi:hypothetical protein
MTQLFEPIPNQKISFKRYSSTVVMFDFEVSEDISELIKLKMTNNHKNYLWANGNFFTYRCLEAYNREHREQIILDRDFWVNNLIREILCLK